MTPADKKKAQVLVALLVVAGLVWFFLYRKGGVTATADKGKTKTVAEKAIKDPKIRIDLIEGVALDEVGQKNIFQYRQKPVAVVAAPPRPAPIPYTPPPSPPPGPPPPPPPPPFKPFKYEGFSVLGKPGVMKASLSEGGNVYTVTLGECLMGQYCVRQLTENSIEIEDTQTKQRRSFQRTLQ
jgi:hypothetical protein